MDSDEANGFKLRNTYECLGGFPYLNPNSFNVNENQPFLSGSFHHSPVR